MIQCHWVVSGSKKEGPIGLVDSINALNLLKLSLKKHCFSSEMKVLSQIRTKNEVLLSTF